jgi:hypothetical protein
MEIDKFELSIDNHVEDYQVDGSPYAWVLSATRSDTTVFLVLKTLDFHEFDSIVGEQKIINVEYGGHKYEIFPTAIHSAELTHNRIYVLEITGLVKGFDMPKLLEQ